ncbi:hypothetical protein REMIM1_CH01539 [Rhizobium etli bv. mimosae str. Mim1]|nr:hypothetical protein REMIM1_CH01539 [Rhizobium etli bv. mimosae str. Mim1]
MSSCCRKRSYHLAGKFNGGRAPTGKILDMGGEENAAHAFERRASDGRAGRSVACNRS